jgi:hypothetical protein
VRRGWLAAVGVVTALGFGGIAGAAQAATITKDGSTWVFTGEGAEVNSALLDFEQGAGGPVLKFADTRANVTSTGGECSAVPGGWLACPYQSGQSVRVALGAGDDTFSISNVPGDMPVSADGGEGNDQLQDAIDDVSALRTFTGGPGNDDIKGYKGPDVLDGGPGNDKLDGGAGADQVLGGEGDDELAGDKYEDPAPDVIDGGPGFDAIDEWSRPTESVNPFVSVTQNGVADDGRPGEGDNVTGIEKIVAHSAGSYEGTAGNDDIWVWANTGRGASTIRGLEGDDKLTGLDESETIDGGPGNDTIQGGFGDDDLTGGPGRDRILGDGGSTCDLYSCTVPAGNDVVRARDGEADSIDCGLGTDTAIVDEHDTVANCETVDRATAATAGGDGATGGGQTGGGGPVIATGKGGAAKALALKAPARQSMRALLAKGMRASVRCAGSCRVVFTLRRGGKAIGTGRRTLLKAGTATATIKVAKKAKRALRRVRKGKLSLVVTVTDAAGKRTTASRSITIAR